MYNQTLVFALIDFDSNNLTFFALQGATKQALY